MSKGDKIWVMWRGRLLKANIMKDYGLFAKVAIHEDSKYQYFFTWNIVEGRAC